MPGSVRTVVIGTKIIPPEPSPVRLMTVRPLAMPASSVCTSRQRGRGLGDDLVARRLRVGDLVQQPAVGAGQDDVLAQVDQHGREQGEHQDHDGEAPAPERSEARRIGAPIVARTVAR